MRKTEYAKMKCRNGGKLCSGIIVFFCLKILFLAVDGFILLAEREAFCNKFDRFYLKFLY